MANDTAAASPGGALGALHCATITAPDAADAAELYVSALGLRHFGGGVLSPQLACAWDAPALAGARYTLVGPGKDDSPAVASCFIRFVEQPAAVNHTPYLSAGWTALELTVGNCDAAIEALRGAGFQVVGEADDLDFAAGALRAGQVAGPFGEILYLTQVKHQIPGFALPQQKAGVGRLFICILASNDLAACIAHYTTMLGCEERGGFATTVPFIAEYHGLARDTLIALGTVEIAAQNYLEIDQMPAEIAPRSAAPGYLPAGVAIVSMMADPDHPSIAKSAITAPFSEEGAVYQGNRTVTLRGFHGELIELIG